MGRDARSQAPTVRIGAWTVHPTSNEIRGGETVRRLEPQVMDLLVYLSGSGGRVVSREDIVAAVWEGRFIAETTLTRAIADLRRALGDTGHDRQYIETIAKRGYRLIAPVAAAAEVADRAADGAPAGAAPRPEPSLVVLPFTNLGPEEDLFFGEGLTEEITNVLARAPGLRVISRTSAFVASQQGGDVAEIARRLGVTHVLEGSTRRAGGRVRVTAQLIRAGDQGHVWSERYDRAHADAFALQDEIAEAIARRLELALGEQDRQGAAPTRSTEAHLRYLEGRHHFLKGTGESLERARCCLSEAVRLDPQFAVAHDALAEVYWYLGFYGLRVPKDAFTQALWALLRALEIDHRLAQSHALLAMLRKELDYDWAEVDREFAIASALDPASPVVRFRHALCGLMPQGRVREAAAELERVADADPLSLMVLWWVAAMHWFAGDLSRMRAWVCRMRDVDERHPLTQMVLGSLRLSEGDAPEAVRSYERAAELAGRPPWLLGWLALACGAAREEGRNRALREELLGRGAADVAPTALALRACGAGDLDEAFTWLDRAVDVRDPHVIPVPWYPVLGPLRADLRYRALLSRLNLTDRIRS